MVVVAVWAFGEAIILPVVPDVALDLLVLAAPGRALRLFVVAAVASMAGSLVLFAFASSAHGTAQALVLGVPGIDAAMLDAARSTVAGGDPLSIAQFGPGTPLKVFTIAWVIGPGSLLPFLVGVVLNRLTRIGPVVLVAAAAGTLAPGWLRRHGRLVLVAYAVAWAGFYVAYFAALAGRDGIR